jgi:NADP-dependent 3-hydroxy acid dehydrogenase YdfG
VRAQDPATRTLPAWSAALVTGAGSGIGRAIALALARTGATVCATGRRRELLESLAKESASGTVIAFPADLSADDQVKGLVSSVLGAVPALDILVHSAGFIALGTMASACIEDFDRHYRTNVRGPYLLTKMLLPAIEEARGHIVFVNSSAGLEAGLENGQYAASKHALRAIADSLRKEVNPRGVRVLSVYPGRTATAMQEAVHRAEGKRYEPERLMQPEDVAHMIVAALELPQTAEVTDLPLRPRVKP